ncbi:sugar ABC transporter substrate-binding protein [Cohnella faecalis]|uniref:Sugar ABC transporter substrate-binding protein n=1 Tax=Cohnella faecalis TaxID=2315694 RepID=A0A398CE60_9BACL|nr:sugar ABC transporter substrate-binding protein [Cohnella faecalis]RIE00920.1 sugar ABC transporter substrate-binding protein [Cohnella faecalis]
MKMRKTAVWQVVAILMITMLVIAGCGKNNEAGSGGSKSFTIGFANINDVYPYCVKVRDYIKEIAGAEGIKVVVANAAGDVKQQNDQIDNFIVQKVNMIAAISGDLDGSVPAVENSLNAKIPYVSLLTHVNTDGYVYVGSENKQAGEVQGEYLAKVLPENAKVLYMTGQTNDQQYIDRKAGLTAKLFDVRKDVQLLAEQSSDNQKDKGMSLTEDWLQSYGKFDAIIAQNDDSALGAVEALKAANRLDGVIVIGIDGSDDALASIEAGEMTMTVFQDAKSQAQAIVDLAKKLRDGAEASSLENINIPFKAITKENLSEAK